MDKYRFITISAERKRGKHFCADERGVICKRKKPGHSNRAIAWEGPFPVSCGEWLLFGLPFAQTTIAVLHKESPCKM